MNLAQAVKRIEELEARIRTLEARLVYYLAPSQYPIPGQYVGPQPYPGLPGPGYPYPTITCGIAQNTVLRKILAEVSNEKPT